MGILLDVAFLVGWMIFLYLGGAGAYELLGGRRYRATLLLVGAFIWILMSFVFFRYTGSGTFRVFFALMYFAVCGLLVWKVHGNLGKPDFR